jgi:hypothetical protein
MPKINKPDWQIEAEKKLLHYRGLFNSIENMKYELETIDNELYSAGSSHMSGVPNRSGGSSSKYEDRLVNKLTRKDNLIKWLADTEKEIEAIDNALNILSDEERKVIELFFTHRKHGKKPIYAVMEAFYTSQSHAYRKVDHAVLRFAINMYGCAVI